MSAGLTTFGASQWAGILFGVNSAPASYYVALCTTEPGKGWDGDILASAEPDDTAYARQLVACDSTHWKQDNNYVSNASPIVFGTPSVDWGVITHYALCSAPTSGQIYMYSSFVRPLRLGTDFYVTVPQGAINLTMDTFSGSYNA